MYEKFGDNFLTQFVSNGFLAAHCSQDVAEQYRQKLQVRKLLFSFAPSRVVLVTEQKPFVPYRL